MDYRLILKGDHTLMKKKLIGCIMSAAVAFSGIFGGVLKGTDASAAQTVWKYDLGANADSGYTSVSASESYSAAKGYGFTGNVSDVTANGNGALSDAVRFNGGTFCADLPQGLYRITVTTGNSPRTTIIVEGTQQMINLTGNNATETIEVPVNDGQLNISAVAGMNNAQYTISAIEITQLNTTGEMRPTIWICGDSTVANYYNVSESSQHGWGQYLKNYVNTNVFEIRNQASSGQYAKGFYEGGQFDAVKAYGKPGDYYIISIGINDTNYSNADEYYNIVTEMTSIAKQKGMKVILVKQQGRYSDLNRNPRLSGRWFGGQLDRIASEQDVMVVDLFNAWQDYGFSIGGYDAMKDHYAVKADGSTDDLHQSAKGAEKNAELVQGLMKIGVPDINTDLYYTFKNVNSGLLMEIKDGRIEEGAVIQQWDANGLSCQSWKLTPFAGGTDYFYIRSAADPNYVLKAMENGNGGSIELVPYNSKDSMMLFKITTIGDGTVYISTRASRDVCYVETANASRDRGAKTAQWEYTYNKCQNWELKGSAKEPTPVTTSPPETQPVETGTEVIPTPVPNTDRTVGDINSDGKINVFDMILLKRLAVSQKAHPVSADLNGDKQADILDVRLIRDFLIGKASDIVKTSASIDTCYYYACDHTFEQGVVETVNGGFTRKKGYVNLDNNDTSNLTFTVNVRNSGNYMTHIRFANGTTEDRQMKIFVNNNMDSYWLQPFTGTGGWDSWNEFGIVLPLTKGLNTIKFMSYVRDKGGPNIDYISLTPTDEPYAETYDPNAGKPDVSTEKSTLYILGDSTVQSYRASYAPQQGWGYYLPNYFTDGINVVNRSMAGRSSKKAYDEGRWQGIADEMKKGDYVMIQFAINDSGKSNADRYAFVCGDVNTPAEGSYEWYMSKFINDTLSKGGTPILVTTVIGMGAYNSGAKRFENSYSDYCDACKKLAAKYSIPCIDLNTIMKDHYNSVGYDTALSYHLMGAVEGSTDGTHFCEKGADVVAGLVANAVRSQKISGLSDKLK